MKHTLLLSQGPVFSQRFQTGARLVVIGVLWMIIFSIAIGKSGIANFMELRHERDVLAQNNLHLQIQNQMLEEQIQTLQTSPQAQVRYLKQNFGYVENGEYIYQFRKK
jgi:cell division protein FtsB